MTQCVQYRALVTEAAVQMWYLAAEKQIAEAYAIDESDSKYFRRGGEITTVPEMD